MMSRPVVLLTVTFLLALALYAEGDWYAPSAAGATIPPAGNYIYVDKNNAGGTQDGTQQYPFGTIADAMTVAASGDKIHVAPGIYQENVVLAHGVRLLGSGADSTIIDGGENGSVVKASNLNLQTIVDGFTIRNGTGTWRGGYTYGGAFYATDSSLVIRNCRVEDSYASDGAGGLSAWDSNVWIEKCVFQNNRGWWGGHVTIVRGYADIHNSIFDTSYGGYGGSLYLEATEASLVNNVIVNNYLGVGVGTNAKVTIVNNTIANNGGYGVGTNVYEVNGSGVATVTNTILWANGNDLVNINATYSNIEDGDGGTGNISAAPLFVNADGGDYRLRPNSKCIDAGDNSVAPNRDLEGDLRPLDGNGDDASVADIGADEYNPLAIMGLKAENNGPTLLGDSTLLVADAISGEALNYTWDFGDGSSGKGQNLSHEYPAVGAYTATVTAAHTSQSKVATTTVQIADVPIAGLEVIGGGPVLLGQPSFFTATVTAGTNVTYEWDFQDGQTGTGPTPQHTFAEGGVYYVHVTARNSRNLQTDYVEAAVDDSARLTVTKVVVGEAPADDWRFAGSGDIGSFVLPSLGGGKTLVAAAGSYTIAEELREGYLSDVACSSGPASDTGSVTVNLVAGIGIECTFTNTADTTTVEGVIYVDANGNGKVDPGEALVGVTVTLSDSVGSANADAPQYEQTDVTDADGTFRFESVPLGTHTLTVLASGSSEAMYSRPLTVLPGLKMIMDPIDVSGNESDEHLYLPAIQR